MLAAYGRLGPIIGLSLQAAAASAPSSGHPPRGGYKLPGSLPPFGAPWTSARSERAPWRGPDGRDNRRQRSRPREYSPYCGNYTYDGNPACHPGWRGVRSEPDRQRSGARGALWGRAHGAHSSASPDQWGWGTSRDHFGAHRGGI